MVRHEELTDSALFLIPLHVTAVDTISRIDATNDRMLAWYEKRDSFGPAKTETYIPETAVDTRKRIVIGRPNNHTLPTDASL